MMSTRPSMFRAELIKLRRASSWVVVIVVPVLTVAIGTLNTMMNSGQLSQTWESLWGQVTLFYGLLFLSVGIAVLASSAWRVEHRGNWPRLMASPAPTSRLVLAKLCVLWTRVAVMQLVLVTATWGSGLLVVGLPPVPPTVLPIGAFVTAVVAGAVVALQSLLSMVIRTYATPIALSVLGCIASLGLLMSGAQTLSLILPYADVQRAASLGSETVAGTPALGVGTIAELAIPALVSTVVFTAAAVAWLERCDVRT